MQDRTLDFLLAFDVSVTIYLILGSLLIAEWCSQLRDICEDFVHKQIDEIASKVKEKGRNQQE